MSIIFTTEDDYKLRFDIRELYNLKSKPKLEACLIGFKGVSSRYGIDIDIDGVAVLPQCEFSIIKGQVDINNKEGTPYSLGLVEKGIQEKALEKLRAWTKEFISSGKFENLLSEAKDSMIKSNIGKLKRHIADYERYAKEGKEELKELEEELKQLGV